ncbi:centromere protein S [Elysia marginata]|uniref:Centromere protein S n=1 Tax=Elysia marginata TaxID=1093978 RepID=A0AAV4EH56_9GAST|nr:centromere protein S [Elysia marginata]
MANADLDQLEKEQQLKAGMYFTMKQISREVQEEMEVSISPQVLATLSESLAQQVQCYAVDLENFAKHAKRTNISVEDVRLLGRRNPGLLQHLNSLIEEQAAQKETTKKPRAKSKAASKCQGGND